AAQGGDAPLETRRSSEQRTKRVPMMLESLHAPSELAQLRPMEADPRSREKRSMERRQGPPRARDHEQLLDAPLAGRDAIDHAFEEAPLPRDADERAVFARAEAREVR